MHDTYMPNKTISVPADVLPIIASLDVPFSQWVAEQLRLHAARTEQTFAQQLLADAELSGDDRPTDRHAVGARMERSAPW